MITMGQKRRRDRLCIILIFKFMIKNFVYKETMCGPFEKDIEGFKSNGFSFSVCNDVSNPFYKRRIQEQWYLIDDGTFIYVIDDDDGTRGCQGTFDSSKYEEYVNQMKQFKTEWMTGLTYEHDDDSDVF